VGKLKKEMGTGIGGEGHGPRKWGARSLAGGAWHTSTLPIRRVVVIGSSQNRTEQNIFICLNSHTICNT